jgi:hypothetical protein
MEFFKVLLGLHGNRRQGGGSARGDREGRWKREDRDDAEPGYRCSDHQGVLREGTAVACQAGVMAPWKLPLVVVAIAVPIAVAFYAGGPGVGVAAGALAGVAIVVVAARAQPRGAIGETPSDSSTPRLLVVVSRPVEDPEAIREIAALAKRGPAAVEAEVLVLAPARIGFLDRWASDVEGARREAQQRLVITVASLAKAGIVAEARVGDEDLVQAVEDRLQSFAATAVVLVTGSAEEDPAGKVASVELERRLRAEFRRLVLSGPAVR